ncbi:MAG TPA: hypothetical protein VIV06_00360 [Candidatus Limnocylindrales bacterium]
MCSVVICVATIAVAACGGPIVTGSQRPTEAGPTQVPNSAAEPSSSVGPVGTTSTDWGQIRNTLPSGFPRFPGAEPLDDAGGPASAALAVPAPPAQAADWYRSTLDRAGYATVGVSGPYEDGSFVVDVSGGRDCEVEVRLAPHESSSIATILYGARCPFS